jgi:hypothetical protein
MRYSWKAAVGSKGRWVWMKVCGPVWDASKPARAEARDWRTRLMGKEALAGRKSRVRNSMSISCVSLKY